MVDQSLISPQLNNRISFIEPKKVVFYTIFSLTFLLSGTITILHIIPYRMGLTSLIILPLILMYGLKISRVILTYIILAVIITLSAIINQSMLLEFLLFLRTLLFSFLIYYLVEIYVNKYNIAFIMRLCIGIAILQLPIVLFQQAFYDQFPSRLTKGIFKIDFDFGTFNANDAPLSIFLTLIVIFLLFDKSHNHIVRYKWPILLWLTFTVLIVNSELGKFIIVVVWCIYLIRYFNPKLLISTLFLFIILIGVLASTGLLNELWVDFNRGFSANTRADPLYEESFLSGNYGRGAAVAYYLNKEIKWFGDGPSRYYDVFSRNRVLGNTGHIFTFYSEVGLLGWLVSMMVFFFIAFPGRGWKIRLTWVGVLSFFTLQTLSFTTEIMNDISIFLIFCLINKSNLIPLNKAENSHGKNIQ